MTALNENERFGASLRIYDECAALQNLTSHLLALQATAQLCDLERGERIREAHVDLQRMSDEKDVVFLSAVMEAFAHNARNVECLALFGDIPRRHRDRVCYAIALKAWTQARVLQIGQGIL